MKVLLLTNIPSPYMVDYLNELGKYCELTAIFERNKSSVRDKAWDVYNFLNFKGIVLKGINIAPKDESDDQAICPQIIKYIRRKKYDVVVSCNPCTPTGIIAIIWMKLLHIPFAIQSEGGFPGNGKGLKERFKHFIMKNAKLYLSTAKLGDDYFLLYGAKKDRIKHFPFSSLYDSEILPAPLLPEDKNSIKNKLSIPYEKVIISVGRFIWCKGFDVFIKSCKKVPKDVGIYIVGGVPSEEYLAIKDKLNLENLHFIGFVSKEKMKEYYKASDIFVLNSRGDTWGLVINEAMSFGLPVISTDKCYAAIALIENDTNGYVVHVDDEEAFSEKMNYLLENSELCKSIAKNNIEKSRQYTVENMAKTIKTFLEEVFMQDE